ncbi:MAG TPA: copper resistance CopC family protein [Methylomirabilota bacterium]|nr:copper resistance CopC family protein [Methylomirabilota bacterium]
MIARALWGAGLLLVTAAPVWGHAFPDHSEPRVGHTVDAPPPAVRIWFDGAIEPVFSTLRVEDGDKRRVDRNDARVSGDGTLLEVSLPPLPPGRYQVFWSVVARDGHRTEGRFPFRIK